MNRIEELIARYPALLPCKEDLQRACEAMICSVQNGGKIMICGNGGSASDAEHIVGELMKSFCRKRPIDPALRARLEASPEDCSDLLMHLQGAIAAISLNSQTSLITAVANDCDASMIFAQQLYGYAKPGDVLIALSTSGNSKNVLNAVRLAAVMGVKTIFIGGQNRGKIGELADIALCLPAAQTYQVQEYTLPVYHALCLVVEEACFGETP